MADDAQVQIAQDGDLDPLIKLLKHADENVRTLASKSISSLAYSGEEVVITGANGYAPLLLLVKQSDDRVRSKAVWTLAILASNEENQSEMVKQMGWDILLELIRDPIVEVQCGGVTLIGNLALLKENKGHLIVRRGADALIRLLSDTADVIVKRAIVTALSNIVDSDNSMEVIDDDGLGELLHLLEDTDDTRLLSGVVHTLSNIANAESSRFNRKIAKTSLEKLTSFITSDVDVLQKGAVMVFNGLSLTPQYQSAMFQNGAVQTMLDLLNDSNDEELLLAIALCITNLSQNQENHDDLLEMGTQDTLVDLLDRVNNDDIQRECSDALTNLGGSKFLKSRDKSKRKRRSSIRPEGTGVKDNVKQMIKMLIDDPSLQRKLQKLGVIPHLVSLISPSQKDETTKGLALDALTMLAMNNGFNQQTIALSNHNIGMQHVEEIIRDPYTKPVILLRAVRLLGTLCWKNRLVQDIVTDRNIPRLVSFLESFDTGLKKAALTAVACLAEGNVKNQHTLHKLKGDKMVCQVIMRESDTNSMVAAAAQAVASICRENPKSQTVCNRVVGSLLHHLENSVRVARGAEDHIVQEHLTDALLELCRNNKENKGILWRMHIDRLLVDILSNDAGSPVTHYNTLGLIWEYCKSDNKCKKITANKQLFRLLLPLCDSEDALVKDAASRVRSKLQAASRDSMLAL